VWSRNEITKSSSGCIEDAAAGYENGNGKKRIAKSPEISYIKSTDLIDIVQQNNSST
jgi:hypothetical protein